MCVCACVCVRARVCVCVRVCVWFYTVFTYDIFPNLSFLFVRQIFLNFEKDNFLRQHAQFLHFVNWRFSPLRISLSLFTSFSNFVRYKINCAVFLFLRFRVFSLTNLLITSFLHVPHLIFPLANICCPWRNWLRIKRALVLKDFFVNDSWKEQLRVLNPFNFLFHYGTRELGFTQF